MYIDKDKILGFLEGLLGIAVVGLLGIGIYHSATKHPSDASLLRWSPFALYRGVEFFWHNDFAGVNWDDKLKEDGRYCIYLFNSSLDESVNPQELRKNTEIFSKNINKYPKDKFEVLKSFSRLFFKYQLILFSEMKNVFRSYLNSGETNLSLSGDILVIENKLGKYLHKEDIDKLKMETKNGFIKFKGIFSQLDALSESERNERLNNLGTGVIYVSSKISSVFKILFNEDL